MDTSNLKNFSNYVIVFSYSESLCGELTFNIKLICNFLVDVINYICYEIYCSTFSHS